MLVKKLNTNHIHLKAPYINNKFITLLLQHQKNIKSLCLNSTDSANLASLSCNGNKLMELAKLVNLEKIHFAGRLPVNDEVVLKILQECPNISNIKLGKLFFKLH